MRIIPNAIYFLVYLAAVSILGPLHINQDAINPQTLKDPTS